MLAASLGSFVRSSYAFNGCEFNHGYSQLATSLDSNSLDSPRKIQSVDPKKKVARWSPPSSARTRWRPPCYYGYFLAAGKLSKHLFAIATISLQRCVDFKLIVSVLANILGPARFDLFWLYLEVAVRTRPINFLLTVVRMKIQLF